MNRLFDSFLLRSDDAYVRSALVVLVMTGCLGAAICHAAAAQAMRLLGDLSMIGVEYLSLGTKVFVPIMVALTITSRVGAGFATEVAILKSERVLDALELFGDQPFRNRLMPMMGACVLATVSLSILGLFAWEFFGATLAYIRWGMNPFSFYAPQAVNGATIAMLLIKASFMGTALYMAALFSGLGAKSGADEVGRATTRAVVFGWIGVLAVNLAVDISFMVLGVQA